MPSIRASRKSHKSLKFCSPISEFTFKWSPGIEISRGDGIRSGVPVAKDLEKVDEVRLLFGTELEIVLSARSTRSPKSPGRASLR